MKRHLVVLLTVWATVVMAAPRKSQQKLGQGQVYVGGRLGVAVPMAFGRSGDEVSFRDVASIGFAGKGDIMWMSAPNIGVGGELGYNSFPYKQQYWSGLNYRGDFEAAYKTISLAATGRLIMGSADLRPMIGIAAGAQLLRNTLDFQSYYDNSDKIESVSYTSNVIRPAYSFEAGFFFKVAQFAQLSVAARFNFVPNVKEEHRVSVDPYTFVEKVIVVNPHGNQNSFEALVGLHFGTKRKGKRL